MNKFKAITHKDIANAQFGVPNMSMSDKEIQFVVGLAKLVAELTNKIDRLIQNVFAPSLADNQRISVAGAALAAAMNKKEEGE